MESENINIASSDIPIPSTSPTPSESNLNTCSVCILPTETLTHCNHYLCFDCKNNIRLTGKERCPICRSPFPNPTSWDECLAHCLGNITNLWGSKFLKLHKKLNLVNLKDNFGKFKFKSIDQFRFLWNPYDDSLDLSFYQAGLDIDSNELLLKLMLIAADFPYNGVEGIDIDKLSLSYGIYRDLTLKGWKIGSPEDIRLKYTTGLNEMCEHFFRKLGLPEIEMNSEILDDILEDVDKIRRIIHTRNGGDSRVIEGTRGGRDDRSVTSRLIQGELTNGSRNISYSVDNMGSGLNITRLSFGLGNVVRDEGNIEGNIESNIGNTDGSSANAGNTEYVENTGNNINVESGGVETDWDEWNDWNVAAVHSGDGDGRLELEPLGIIRRI